MVSARCNMLETTLLVGKYGPVGTSCGVHAFADVHVTPTRLSRGYYHKNTGEKHDAKGKARLRERAAAMSAATR